MRKLPHVPKFGAEFAMGDLGSSLHIDFVDGFCPGTETINVERCLFDQMLLEQALRAGAEVRQTSVKQILKLSDGDVKVQTDTGEIRGRYLLDASGQSTVVGRHLGTRKSATQAELRKVAYFNQFEGAWRRSGAREGHPLIAMTDEGWFWMIPLNPTRTSVGMVLDAEIARSVIRDQNISPDRLLEWGIARCPAMRDRMKLVKRPMINMVLADYTYSCRPFAGDGYFLIGDAATFLDPIFSTGVSVAVNGAIEVAQLVDDVLARRIPAARARRIYISHLEQSTGALFHLVRQYYDHDFRELFMHGKGPLAVHRAVIGVLAGNVFPKPPLKIRWRLRFFDFLVAWHRKRGLVPKQARHSLLNFDPTPQIQPQETSPLLAVSVAERPMAN